MEDGMLFAPNFPYPDHLTPIAIHSTILLSLLVLGLKFTSAAPTRSFGFEFKLNNNVAPQEPFKVQVGSRPYYLVDDMDEGPLKQKLLSCSEQTSRVSKFVMGHRGAPMLFPEHTREAYMAAARQGAGGIECDVTFTSDKKLVCRHDHCDLHYTTNILETPLAAKCTNGFTPYNATTGTEATANCCSSDITLREFRTLCGKMDAFNPHATTVSEYLAGTPSYRTDLYSSCGTLLTHIESIELINSYGRDFSPEAKTPLFDMPFDGYTQEQFVQDIADDYKRMAIDPSRVWLQSFLPADVYYWINHEPFFARQVVYLDERMDTPAGYDIATASLPGLAEKGVKIVAPSLFALTKLDGNNSIVPSEYAVAAREAGLKIIGWSFERSAPFVRGGGGYFYQFVGEVVRRDGDMYKVLDVLVKDVGIFKMFSDWPATVVYYANCMGLP